MKVKPVPQRSKTLFFRVTADEYKAAALAANEKSMLLSVWLRAVVLQKLGIEPKI